MQYCIADNATQAWEWWYPRLLEQKNQQQASVALLTQLISISNTSSQNLWLFAPISSRICYSV